MVCQVRRVRLRSLTGHVGFQLDGGIEDRAVKVVRRQIGRRRSIGCANVYGARNGLLFRQINVTEVSGYVFVSSSCVVFTGVVRSARA